MVAGSGAEDESHRGEAVAHNWWSAASWLVS